ncbi:MAG: hypothetical protein ACLUFA_11405 [[Clostridium] leptum]
MEGYGIDVVMLTGDNEHRRRHPASASMRAEKEVRAIKSVANENSSGPHSL